MLKQWEIPLYSFTAFVFAFFPDIRIFIALFIIVTALLVMVLVRCGKLMKNFDQDRYVETKKMQSAAETLFIMTAIFTLFVIVRAVAYMVTQPQFFFGGSTWLSYFLMILLAVGLLGLFQFTSSKLIQVQQQKSLIDRPPLVKQEEFFAFSNTAVIDETTEEEEEDTEDPPDKEMPDASALLEELVPDEEDFKQHIQHMSAPAPADEAPQSEQLWECPFCGFLNLSDGGQCDFCGAESKR